MRVLFSNKKGVSNVFGYLFSFAVASMVMISAVIMTKNVMDDRAAKVGNMEAQSIANKVADAIVEAMAVGQSMTNSDYSRALDLPNDIAGLNYYIEITEKFVYVNTTNGVIRKSCPNYGAGSSNIGVANGKIYGGTGSVSVILDRPDPVYKFDFGTGNVTSHSPVETGYFVVTNKSAVGGSDAPWLDEYCKARVPILVENDSPESMIDTPVKIVLSPSNFDYSMANVTVNSSSSVKSDLTFYDPSLAVVAKIDVTPEWDPSWFYTYYGHQPNPPQNVIVTINELSGGYTNYYIDEDTIKLKVMGRTGGREADTTSWNIDAQGKGNAYFNGKEALEMLEDGDHYLNPGYNIVIHGFLKNGVEFSGSRYIPIKNAIYAIPGDNAIETAVGSAQDGSTIFISEGDYAETFAMPVDKAINLIGENVDNVMISQGIYSGVPLKILEITDKQNTKKINIDSLSFSGSGAQTDSGIYIQGSYYINITNCRVYNCNDGMRVRKGGSSKGSSNVSIHNCKTYNNVGDPGTGKGDGINIAESHHIRITDCESYGNNNKEGDGIDIYYCTHVDVINCVSRYNIAQESNGILLEGSLYCNINNSFIYGNYGSKGDGIEIKNSNNSFVRNCTISNHTTDGNAGIFIFDSGTQGNVIENCTIYNNDYGVGIYGGFLALNDRPSANNIIRYCNIYNNKKDGVLLESYFGVLQSGCRSNTIEYCNIYNNGNAPNKIGDGIHLTGSDSNIIRYCNVFDNGDDGLHIGADSAFSLWSDDNTVQFNNFYCNRRKNFLGAGVYCQGKWDGLLGVKGNVISNNNFGYDYPYKGNSNNNLLDANLKYAVDGYNGAWLPGLPKNSWSNNYFDNYYGSGTYKIPNDWGDSDYGNTDNTPRTNAFPSTNTPVADYVIVEQKNIWYPNPMTISEKQNVSDSYISKQLIPLEQDKNYGNEELLLIDPYDTAFANQVRRILIRFDLSKIPHGSTINDAELRLYYKDYWSGGQNPAGLSVGCYKLNTPWTEYTVRWNKPSPLNFNGATVTDTIPNAAGWMTWNVKNDVTNFYSGSTANWGWLIKYTSEDKGDYYQARFYSSESSQYRPQLRVSYTLPPGGVADKHYHTKTIANGTKNVSKNGTVFVKLGSTGAYGERITINKPLKLIGASNSVTINGMGSGNVIYIKNHDVTIDSLTVKNGQKGIYIFNTSVPSSTSKINIKNCIISDNTQQGIFINWIQTNVKDCEIRNNGIGICTMRDSNKIENCNIHNNTNEGIRLNATANKIIKIANCSINDNNKGIYLERAHKSPIENCALKRNTLYGIELTNSGYSPNGKNTITNCIIVGTGSSGNKGIYLNGNSDYNDILSCDVSKNKLCGIELSSDANDNFIRDCIVHDNDGYGINLTTSSSNKIYHNKFVNNNGAKKDAYDSGANLWDNGYANPNTDSDGGGNLWDDYDEPDEGAVDYKSGSRTENENQIGAGSDGIADVVYRLDPASGAAVDKYPWCKKPIEMPYYIDYWNPNGESVILVNMSLTNHSLKYLYLYYGSTKPATNHSIAEVSVFFDEFNDQNLNTNKWKAVGGFITTDGKGNLTLDSSEYVITKVFSIQKTGDPLVIPYTKTINQSMYIVEAKMNTSETEGDLILLSSYNNDQSYWISINSPAKKIFLNQSSAPGTFGAIGTNPISYLNHWIRIKANVYETNERYLNTEDISMPNGSRYVNITGTIYNFDSYFDDGYVSGSSSQRMYQGGWIVPPAGLWLNGSIGLGCGLSSYQTNPLIVDWIRVMKAPVIPPTITIGAMDSANYGWETTDKIHSKNIIQTGIDAFENPFNPGPVLRDFNYGNETGTFVIKNLTKGEYTVTITIGNVSGKCDATKAAFYDNESGSYGEMIIPATETGEFETKWHIINFNWDEDEARNLEIEFSSINPNGNWTVNAMTIERGKKGVKIDL